jgi:hypothetical protein
MSLDLSELFNKYGSDKDRNGYSPLYHTLFDKIKNNNLNILEIGIGSIIPDVPSSMKNFGLDGYKPGGSLRAWRDYFVNSRIIGVDIQPDTQFSEERIETYLCNSIAQEDVKNLMNDLKIEFDIIIDDGCHNGNSQIFTLNNFYPYLKQNGLYIVEDIYEGSEFISNRKVVKQIVNNDPLFFSSLINNQCIIFKSHLVSSQGLTNF